MSEDLATPAPAVAPETEAFWEAAADGRLLVRRCRACGDHFHYPRARCPHCGSPDTEWVEADGRGTVYSYTVTRQAGGEYADATPFVLAYVELAEGPRMLTNLVDCDPEAIEVGRPVRVVFHDAGEDTALPRFTPE